MLVRRGNEVSPLVGEEECAMQRFQGLSYGDDPLSIGYQLQPDASNVFDEVGIGISVPGKIGAELGIVTRGDGRQEGLQLVDDCDQLVHGGPKRLWRSGTHLLEQRSPRCAKRLHFDLRTVPLRGLGESHHQVMQPRSQGVT
ncbi:MAG: hypothetical protein HY597_02965 [Candidatus Omnitrophica bacterium]|nr:hypothetical protein [Candidatus Omnitrophota bacterium]